MARDELFSKAGGDRPDKPNVLIVMTDGEPEPIKYFDATKEQISNEFEVRNFIAFVP